MKKTLGMACIAFLSLLAVSFASCSSALPSPAAATARAAYPSVPAISQPADYASPTPLVTATPGPVSALLPPEAPLTDNDFFIIDKNWIDVASGIFSDYNYFDFDPYETGEMLLMNGNEGYRYGVIDAHGNIILPFGYLSITEMLFDTDEDTNISKYHYFFAEEYAAVGWTTVLDSGYLYDITGNPASEARYDWMRKFGDAYIIAKRTSVQRCGIMTADLHAVVPFDYADIVDCGGWLAASYKKDGVCWIDFFSGNMKLLGTLQAGGTDISVIDDGLLLAMGLNGKLGFIDEDLTWCAEPQWDSYSEQYDNEDNYSGPGYSMWIGDRKYNVNKYGETFIPRGCDPEHCELVYGSYDGDGSPLLYDGHGVYLFDDRGSGNEILFTDTGKILYRSADGFDAEDGSMPAEINAEDGFITDVSHALGPDGNVPDGFEVEDGVIIDGNKALDLDGNVLYESQVQGGTLSYTNGVFIDNGRAVDKTGRELLPGVTNVARWDPDIGLYICGGDGFSRYGTDFYTEDGIRLPLPPGYRYEYLSPDRFIASDEIYESGICNREGQWLLYPGETYLGIDAYDWPVFEANPYDGSMYGVLDNNGDFVLNPIFDYVAVLSERRGLYEVLYNGIHGVIDSKGNWIWYSDSYSNLTD
jgi:hypothetical protein